MHDFRLANVLTRHGIEGKYVVVDMESAGPDCTEWHLDPLDQWGERTLNQVRTHGVMHGSDCTPVTCNVPMLTISVSLMDCLN